jgi:hypothetical protein
VVLRCMSAMMLVHKPRNPQLTQRDCVQHWHQSWPL